MNVPLFVKLFSMVFQKIHYILFSLNALSKVFKAKREGLTQNHTGSLLKSQMLEKIFFGMNEAYFFSLSP